MNLLWWKYPIVLSQTSLENFRNLWQYHYKLTGKPALPWPHSSSLTFFLFLTCSVSGVMHVWVTFLSLLLHTFYHLHCFYLASQHGNISSSTDLGLKEKPTWHLYISSVPQLPSKPVEPAILPLTGKIRFTLTIYCNVYYDLCSQNPLQFRSCNVLPQVLQFYHFHNTST